MAKTPPVTGQRWLIHALVRFDTMQVRSSSVCIFLARTNVNVPIVVIYLQPKRIAA
jgi:hypothetical protein